LKEVQVRRFSVIVALLVFSSILCLSTPANATPTVLPIVTSISTGFHYSYSITNDLIDDFLLIDIHVLAFDVSLTNLFAPAGFQAVYDSGLGIVTFLPDVGSLAVFAAGTTLTGFGFDSAYSPAPTTFDALTLPGNVISGMTSGPVGPPQGVPEPNTLFMVSLGVAAFCVYRGGKKSPAKSWIG
jgi:hypothetical protein